VLQEKGTGLKEKLRSYKDARKTTWQTEHRRYLHSIDPGGINGPGLQAFHSALASATLALPATDVSVYDKRMMYVDGDGMFQFLSPLAKLVMIDLANKEYDAVQDMVVKEILSNTKYSNDTKGRVAETYIISTASRNKSWRCAAKMAKGRNGQQLEISIDFISISFPTMGVPESPQHLNWTKNSMLLDPIVPNYPAVDLLLWDAATKTLYAIQITIKKVGDHMTDTLKGVESKWEALRNLWKQLLPAEATIKLVWLADNDDCDKDFKSTQWVMLFKDAFGHCELLRYLKKQ
jgi:hypothetical protein